MKFIINHLFFQRILNSLYKVAYEASGIKNKSIFITASKEKLSFFVKNNYIALEKKVSSGKELTIATTGKVIVNAFVLNELVQKTKETISFEVIENSTIIIKTKSYHTKLNVVDFNFWQENEYEKISQEQTVFPHQNISKLISQVGYATDSKADGNQIFRGVNFKTVAKKLLAVATDGSRIVEKMLFPFQFDFNLIIPLVALVELNRINNLEREKEVNFFIGKNKTTKKIEFVAFELGEKIKLYANLIEGKFPDTSKQFPQTSTTELTCSSQTLVAAIEKASVIFEKNALPTVVLKVVDEKFFVSSLEKSEVGFFEEEIEVETKKPLTNQKVSLQAKLVLATLKSFTPGKSKIVFANQNDPVLFLSENDPELRVLILPLWIY